MEWMKWGYSVKLDNLYWVYRMECVPSGRVYVGQTGKPNPCWRWSDLFLELRNSLSKSPLLQQEWNRYPDFCAWQFRALERVTGKRTANFREAAQILLLSESARLNVLTTSCVTLSRRRAVQHLLGQKTLYRDIQKLTGLSQGMISKIKRQTNEFSARKIA
jgi:uncharacterized protein YerC